MSAKHYIDGEGFVERLDVFGDDLAVVNAARVSFAKESTEMSLPDEKLIRYLARNNHITPFFHPQIRFRLRMPIFVAREWFRHTVGFSRNEVSRRYVDMRADCWTPRDALRLRDKSVKQGSQDKLHPHENTLLSRWGGLQAQIIEFYEEMLEGGVAPEVARGILPQSMYTEFIETGSLYAYARLCKLRLDPHAQKEIRRYAEKIHQCLVSKFPVSWKYLVEGYCTPAPAVPAVVSQILPLTVPTVSEPIVSEPVVSEPVVSEPAIVSQIEDEQPITITLDETVKVGYIRDTNLVGHFGIGC